MDNTKRKAKADYNAKHINEINACSDTFVSNLKNAREALHLTQEDIANELDIKLVTYRKYEQGENRKDIPYYIKSLAQAVNVSADYLVGLSETPHPEYEEIIKTTGLNEHSLQQLQKLHKLDGDVISQGYLAFINCFLGNDMCTDIFMQALMPKLRSLNSAIDIDSSMLIDSVSIELTDIIYDYIRKVVVPTYIQQYNSGSYTPMNVNNYLSNTTHSKQKRKG